MRDMANHVRQPSDDPRPDPEILHWPSFCPYWSHQKAKHDPKSEDRQRNHDESGNKRYEHGDQE
jgi:hypothetical protein